MQTRILLALLFTIGLLVPLAALAQATAPDYTLLGAGVRSRPAFDGSDSQKTDLIPVVRYYGRPWFARTTQGILEGGARTELSPGVNVGAQLAYEQGPRDRDAGASVGVHAEWDLKIGEAPVSLLARLRRHTDDDRGMQMDLRATAGVYASGPLQLGVFAQASFGDDKYFRKFYAVSESGPLFGSVGLLGSYDLSRHWVLVGSLEGRRLTDDAMRSPIVERRRNYYASIGLAYRF